MTSNSFPALNGIILEFKNGYDADAEKAMAPPLHYSCLETPRDGGAWWAAVYGVTQSRTQLKWLSMMQMGLLSCPVPNTILFSPEDILTRAISLPSGSVYVKAILLSFLIFFSFYLGCLFVALIHYIRYVKSLKKCQPPSPVSA